jgi:lipopolysaccharide biosynthesis glycosyltransferase
VGDAHPVPDLDTRLPWAKPLGVEFRWVGPELFADRSYFSTAVERWRHPSNSDVHVSLDADTIVLGALDPLIAQCQACPAVYGMVTHISPLQDHQSWGDYFASYGLPSPETPFEHTGWGYMETRPSHRFCPPYFNLGVIVGPTAMMRQIGGHIYDAMDASDRVLTTSYKCQIGLTLAIAKCGLPAVCLPCRWNFANDVNLEALHPEEAREARVIHYLREHQAIDRESMFNHREGMLRFLDRTDLRMTNAKLQSQMRALFDVVDEEQRAVAPEYRW